MEHKNLELVKGIPISYEFEVRDDTGILYDLTDASLKFEVRTHRGKLVLTKTVENSSIISLSALDTLKLDDDNNHYRLVLQSLPNNLPVKEVFKGTITADGTEFDSALTEDSGPIVLPGGTLYPTGPLVLEVGVWYAAAAFYRFMVSGTGIVSLDGRNIVGYVTGNAASFVANDFTDMLWQPNLGDNVEFRLNNIVAAPTVRYLP